MRAGNRDWKDLICYGSKGRDVSLICEQEELFHAVLLDFLVVEFHA